ncbi:MAG: DUF2156 domain-containing protein [Deltaproteobacteria bacterium]|nr:DUF2156 domain-containing protein [Deltaproteobacteria bacterium]
MPTMRSLALNDGPAVVSYLRRFPPEISELTFTNLFVWRKSRPVYIAEIDDSLVFLTNTGQNREEDKLVLGYPVGKVSLLGVAEALDIDVAGFIRIPENVAKTLQDANVAIKKDRDNSDYVYRVTDLAELPGRRFHKKRNLIKQCLSTYPCQYEPFSQGLMIEYSDMQDRWCQARQCKHEPGLCNEYVAIREMFDHYLDLPRLIGGAIRINGAIQAYAIGEELNPGTAVCHFEKAMPGFRGLGQLINQWFARHTLKNFEFVNREQDLGIPGLRQAKESYYPHHMVEKFNAWFSADRYDKAFPVEPRECERHEIDNV